MGAWLVDELLVGLQLDDLWCHVGDREEMRFKSGISDCDAELKMNLQRRIAVLLVRFSLLADVSDFSETVLSDDGRSFLENYRTSRV